MLDKLSSALKKATDKIANAVFLDKTLVDGIVKELQRALIEADVNVQLVLEITKKIKQSALDERIKGIEKKEHLIKLLHDELKAILGESKTLTLKKQNTFMMLGLYGAGKCVHGDTNIQLADGNIKKIEGIYDEYSGIKKPEILEDGFIIDITEENLSAPSFNPKTLKIEYKKITHLWKLKKEDLYEIYLDNGNDFSIKVTPEHPFFVLRGQNILEIRADELEESDWIATPENVKIQGKTISLEKKLKLLPLSVRLSVEKARCLIKNKRQAIKDIHKCLSIKRNYCSFTSELKEGNVPIELIDKLPNIIIVKEKRSHKYITIPVNLTSEFAEFLGYLMGDGNIRPNYVQISNEDSEIINRVKELSIALFNLNPIIKPAKRTEKMYDIRIASKTLVSVLSVFGLYPGKKGKELKIPEEMMLSDNEVIRKFSRAYFDCDSSPANNKRDIELVSESNILIRQFCMLLKRFGIISKISKKIINSVPYYRLNIHARYAERYAERIGFLIKNKRERADKYADIGLIQGCGNQDMVPLGKFLKETRQLLGFSIGEIQENAVYSYGIYEKKGLISKEKLKQLLTYYSLKRKGIYFSLLDDLQKNEDINKKYGNGLANGVKKYLNDSGLVEEGALQLSFMGQKYLQQIRMADPDKIIMQLEYLANSDISWVPIKTIQKIKNTQKFVYDLTIKDNHSFIAEGFIVHNTTTISKLALYYSKRGHKVAAIGLDVHRPAASEQLKQLGEKGNFAVFIDKEEKNPAKIWKKYEKELEKYDLVLVDTAGRDALDSELVEEIKTINKTAKPTETFLVMQADIGQAAQKQAKTFKEAVNITGVIITRMDSTAKAGGALTACHEAKVPVVFIGTGEKPHDLELFDPESFLSRLLGMGDLKSLMEKIHSVTDEKKLKQTQANLEAGKLTLRDVQAQLESMESLGSMDKIMSMIPGLGKAREKITDEQLEQQQKKMKNYKNAINSMTKEEIENPELLEKQTSRIQRVAKGSGTSTSDIRALIKQYKLLNDLVKNQSAMSEGKMDQKTLMKMARKLGKKGMRM